MNTPVFSTSTRASLDSRHSSKMNVEGPEDADDLNGGPNAAHEKVIGKGENGKVWSIGRAARKRQFCLSINSENRRSLTRAVVL